MYDCVSNEIKDLLLRKIPVSGIYSTPIPGLTLLRGHEGAKSIINISTLPIIAAMRGVKNIIRDYNNIIFSENDYFISDMQSQHIMYCTNIYGTQDVLAFSLKISRHVLSLLDSDFSNACHQQKNCIMKIYDDDIKVDLLKCFHRLIGLLDKPEQIYIRAPIIICEIHYLILISNKWNYFKPLNYKSNYNIRTR